MTIAAITSHAVERPNAVAVINNGIAITYAELARAVGSVGQALGELGLRPGHSVAIECRDQYLHLLLLLGCERAGVVSGSVIATELEQPLQLLSQVDLAITEHPERAVGARKVHAVTKSWVERALALPGAEGPSSSPSSADGIRLVRTSGTTGRPKLLLLTRRAHLGRVERWREDEALAPGHRYLMTAPFTLHAMYISAAASLRAGATVVFERRMPMAAALRPRAITHLKMLPLQLRDLLDRLPPDFVRLPGLLITALGGKLSASQREMTLARLAGGVREQYGSNETGPVAAIDLDNATPIAAVHPGNMVEVVGDDDRVRPFGEVGRVRIKTPFMVDGYVNDPEASARMFRGGWFYPGDLGKLHGPGRIEILGRADGILNIGGEKVLPETVEESLRGRAAVEDVAVCALPNAEGIDEIWIAAVYAAPDDRDIRARLKSALADFPYGHVHLVKVERIPRTATGKIKRAELREAVIAATKAPKL
jgi:fatty-acyl-CoA synthase